MHPSFKQLNSQSNFYCDLCEVEFNNQSDLGCHQAQHQTCGLDGCKFVASPEQLKNHIFYLHSSGLYNRLQSGYTKDEIEKWKTDRQKNYPNSEKSIAAAEKRLKVRELKHQRYLARLSKRREQEEQASAKRKAKNEYNKNKKKQRKNTIKRDLETHQHGKPFEKFKFVFPEWDQDEEDGKNGSVKMFCGTRSYLQSLTTPGTKIYDEDDEETCVDIDISDEDEWLDDKNPNLICNQDSKEFIVDETDSDNDPIEVPISKEDTFIETSSSKITANIHPDYLKTSDGSSKKSAQKAIHRAEADKTPAPKLQPSSFRLVQKSRRNPTLLERLLEKDILSERSQILQCVKFICDKKFFGIGDGK